MRRLLALGVLGLVAIGACGSGSGADTKVLGHTFDRASVSGVVRRDGVAVVGARVSLDALGASTTTDVSGSYRFEAVEPGSYRMVVADTGDPTRLCSPSEACITSQPARHAAVDVVVAREAVVADVDL